FVQAAALICQINGCLHRSHSHRRHRWHEEGDADLRPANRRALRPLELHSESVVPLTRRIGLSAEFHPDFCSVLVHARCCSRARRRRYERAGGCLQLALRIDQEICRTDYCLTCLQSLGDDCFVARVVRRLHLARRKVAFASADEDQLTHTCVQHGRRRHYESASQRDLEVDVNEHSRHELQAWIGQHDAHAGSTCIHVYLGQHFTHSSRECPSRISIHRYQRGSSRFELAQVILKNVRVHPHIRQVSHRIQAGFGLDIHVGQRIAFSDESRYWRVECKIGDDLSARLQLLNLGRWNFPLLQTLPGRGQQVLRTRRHATDRTGLHRFSILLRQQVFLLRGYQVGTVDREEWLTFADELITRVRIDLPYPSRKTCLHVGYLALVDFHVPAGTNFICHILHFHGGQLHADLLHAFRCELYRGQWRFKHRRGCWRRR